MQEYQSSESEHRGVVGPSEIEIPYPTGLGLSSEATSTLEESYLQPDLHINVAGDIWDGARADSMTTMVSRPRQTRDHSSTETEQERPAVINGPRRSASTPLGTQLGSALLEVDVPQLPSPLRMQNRQFRRSRSEWPQDTKDMQTNAASLREESALAKQQSDTLDQELEIARQRIIELTVELRTTKEYMESSALRADEAITKMTERVTSRVVASEARNIYLQQALADKERERGIEMQNGGPTLRELFGIGQTSGSDHGHASQASENAPEIEGSSDEPWVWHSHPQWEKL